MMDVGLAILTYLLGVLFLLIRNNLIVKEIIKGLECHKKFNLVEYYECKADYYASFISLNGERFLLVGDYENQHAYFHELGHLIFDDFITDSFLYASVLLPVLLVPLPWNFVGALLLYIASKWVKKNWERRADIFAYQMTGLKYSPMQLEKSKVILLFHWLFETHPPEIVRTKEEYYKKEIPLIKLFFESLVTKLL
jgi:hypothetical protein